MVKLLHQLPQMESVNLGYVDDLPDNFHETVNKLLSEYEKKVKEDQKNLEEDMEKIFERINQKVEAFKRSITTKIKETLNSQNEQNLSFLRELSAMLSKEIWKKVPREKASEQVQQLCRELEKPMTTTRNIEKAIKNYIEHYSYILDHKSTLNINNFVGYFKKHKPQGMNIFPKKNSFLSRCPGQNLH
jgi:signal recognition particle GTPase